MFDQFYRQNIELECLQIKIPHWSKLLKLFFLQKYNNPGQTSNKIVTNELCIMLEKRVQSDLNGFHLI